MNSRGSSWNKWDLHIHTPVSICNNYGGDTEIIWDRFISSLEQLPDEVKVIGINDYYFIDGFEKVMDFKMNKGRLKNIEKIFPVLEFRIDTFASASETKFQKINYHILFNIDEDNWRKEVAKIKNEFIDLIKLSKLPEHQTKRLSKENFIDVAGSLQNGFDNIVPNTEDVIKYVNSDTWRDRTFIFIGYKEWSNLDKKQQLKLYKENIFDEANAFFTASKTDNIENKEDVIKQFGNKAIIHSNDIHGFESLGENYSCFTWIKAECTFEGLKQILFEQNERLKIQQSNPEYDEEKPMIIDSIKISNSNGWFGEEELLLNRGLISIIGEKGAGKTALLDITAVANEEGIYEQDIRTPYSFYNRAKDLIKGSEVYIKNVGSSDVNKYILTGEGISNGSNAFGRVRYLSLKELESYCDDKEKLQSFIKNIIHTREPETKRYDVDSKNILKKINEINLKIEELTEEILSYSDIQKQLIQKQKELEIKNNNEPKIETCFTDEQISEYKHLLTKKQQLKTNISRSNTQINKVKEVYSWINCRIKEIQQEISDEINERLKGIDNEAKEEFLNLSLDIKIRNSEIILQRIKSIEEDIKSIKEEEEEVDNKIIPLEKLNESYENQNIIIKSWIEQKKKLENEIECLNASLSAMNETKDDIKAQGNKRTELIKKLLNNKLEQKKKYYELKGILEADSNITFEVDINYDEQRLFDIENEKVNHNMGNAREVILKNLKELYISRIATLNEENLEDIVNVFKDMDEDKFINNIFGDNRNKKNLMKKNYSISEFYNLIYGDYYNVNYSISFKNKKLQLLSPGQKGLVLMKIFLKLDDSNKPLLIDQPEENLDNKSVYRDLVEDLKVAKKRRQVIIATHNPNLVINTDSEQIIIAKFEENEIEGESRIRYVSGALEDNSIKKMVCDILEGGDIAFMKREKRYNL